MRFFCILICLLAALFSACSSCNRSGHNTAVSRTETKQQRPRKLQIAVKSPADNGKYPLGAVVTLSAAAKEGAEAIDSMRWFVDGKWLTTVQSGDAVWNTAGQVTGTHRLELIAHYASGQRDIVPAKIILLAPQAPDQYTYKIIREFPHDATAYTQGLLFSDGYLYESTGLKGESSLRKVDLQTGQPLQAVNLPKNVFGEGLALAGDRLIQLTYQEQIAFIYQKSDFRVLNRISYPMAEGWGLTFDGTHLLMTDGTATLYFLDSNYLAELRRLQVCDHKEQILYLNELEYIRGELWANVYLTDRILRIDPKTGIVLGVIDLAGLLKNSDRTATTDVLNGIAYDAKNDKIYVTGKNWPKLFEIQIIKK